MQTQNYCRDQYFYPRSPCGERLFVLNVGRHQYLISIHALLAESDIMGTAPSATLLIFLSTLSLRRATLQQHQAQYEGSISIHALLAESDGPLQSPLPRSCDFYPRSPCGERRRIFSPLMTIPKFLSTLSLRRATGQRLVVQPVANISIHALLAESDPSPRTPPASGQNFYPRSPCGERRESPDSNRHCENFYPRSPCGERRLAGLYTARRRAISIHALLAESDRRIIFSLQSLQ